MTTAEDLDPTLFSPEPEQRRVKYTVISVDDHLVEPPDMFDGRLPARFQADAPRIEETAEGHQVWTFEGKHYTQVGINGVAGGAPRAWPWSRSGSIRCARGAGTSTPESGTWTSTGYGPPSTPLPDHRVLRAVFSTAADADLGLATTRAWNDWLYDEWYSSYPKRIIPLGITFLTDPELGAMEIRRNAERGFKSVAPRAAPPHRLALPVRRALAADHRGLRGDRDSDQPACWFLGIADMPPAHRPWCSGPPCWAAIANRLFRMVVVRVGSALPRPEDCHVRGWHRLGSYAP